MLTNRESQRDVVTYSRKERNTPVPRYLNQFNILTIVRHLSLLLMEAQKHRGSGMAVLEGNSDFEPHVLRRQVVIQRLFDVINLIDRQCGHVLLTDQWKDIERDWQVLIQNWRNDSVITNFGFHSHIIDRLVKLIWDVTVSADYFSAPIGNRNGESSESEVAWLYSEQNHRDLVQITLHLMPELLENIAKLRGLATHASARGYCDSESRTRIGYFLQSLNLNSERLRVASRALQHEALRAVPALPAILLHEHKIVQLKQLIEQKVMIDGKISIKSVDVFNFVTEIIETYSRIIRDGINAFQRRIERSILVIE